MMWHDNSKSWKVESKGKPYDNAHGMHVWRHESRHGILVVDNCPKDLHNRLTNHIQHPESRLSLFTIGPEPEPDAMSTDSFPYIQLHPVDEKIIRNMLSQDYSGLAGADLNFIVRESAPSTKP